MTRPRMFGSAPKPSRHTASLNTVVFAPPLPPALARRDASGQRRNRCDRKSWRSSYLTHSVGEIGPRRFKSWPRPLFAGSLFQKQNVAELTLRFPFRLLLRHAAGDQVFGFFLEMLS